MIVFRVLVGRRASTARRTLPLIAAALLAGSCDLEVTPFHPPQTYGKVGLDFDVVNGVGKAIAIRSVDGADSADGSYEVDGYYVNQLRFQVRQTEFPVPDVLEWVANESALAAGDWTGTTTVLSETARERNGTYTTERGHLNAAWMAEEPNFTISFYDAGGNRLGEPIDVRSEDYIHARRTAISWIERQPAPGNYGGNAGSYSALTVDSGGAFAGSQDEIYDVVVTTGGVIGAGGAVSVSSVRGGDPQETAVVSGTPIDLGTSGATITFTDGGATELVEGDHWVVRCLAGDEPEVTVEEGPKAVFSAIAEIRLQFPHAHVIKPFTLPMTVTEARVKWAATGETAYVIPITMEEPDAEAPGYGLQVKIKGIDLDKVYAPGDTIDLSVDMLDGKGMRLHDEGALPTYRQYVTGQANGVMYFDLNNDPSLGFFTENRLNLMRIAIYGPLQSVVQNYTTDEPEFYLHEVNLPDIGGVILAGFGPPPTTWDEPVPNGGEFVLPEDAEPGTYIALAKTARSFKGERIYREEHIEFQVGTAEETHFIESVGNCEVCHTGEARMSRLRHGISIASPKFCEPCHAPPNNEPIAATVHRVHFFSSKYPVRKSGCSLCHLSRDSNTRASIGVCGACHGAIHPGEEIEFDPDPWARCGQVCHKVLPEIHVIATTY